MGADRELDVAIADAIFPPVWGEKRPDGAQYNRDYLKWERLNMSRPTASLDAALTLVPEGYGWRLWVPNSDVRMLNGFPNLPRVTMWGNRRSYAPYDTPAATPALALAAASLRAMASKEDNGGE
jgi:hypothetical protein